ncbi:hypothetical protein A2J03_03025 [Rhodococcus sp. EPR-157]|nr:hypothetical protein A2J03_03025 [Rhodococcus sp. EPR-157]
MAHPVGTVLLPVATEPNGVGSLAEELTIFVGYALLGTARMLGYERFRSCASRPAMVCSSM